MPLPRPDKQLLASIISKRENRWDDEPDLFTRIQSAAIQAIADGSLNAESAQLLAEAINSEPIAREIFPNNVLLAALQQALKPGGWNAESEHDLLVFIFCIYSGASDLEDALEEVLVSPLPLFGDLHPALFDQPTEPVSLNGKICDFTGAFACGSRRKCFDLVADAGGAASEGGRHTDYLFVAEKHIAASTISSAIRLAAARRLRFGKPLILPESYFPARAAVAS